MIFLLAALLGVLHTVMASNRPLIHFTPQNGWMNDPNGPWYDAKDKLYHLYFQYTPNDTTGQSDIHWGHASSTDLSKWTDHGSIISPDKPGTGIFSGSVVVDYNNTSGFFNESVHPSQRAVALYTLNSAESQVQELAYSTDGGFSFTKYENNPVLEANSTQFRDPKVFWHEPSHHWIMVLAKSQEYKIQIFGSTDLKNWVLHSDFSAGLYGFQYECPGLMELPVEGTDKKKWVMILAINPGMPLGGSANQYFIGDFDGYKFTPDDRQTRIHDHGKDFYAFQTFSDTPEKDGVLGVAWASNWQYARHVPTDPWRGSTGIVRKHKLGKRPGNPETDLLTLLQEPVFGESIQRQRLYETQNQTLTKSGFSVSGNETGVFDIDVEFTVSDLEKGSRQLVVKVLSNKVNGTQEEIKFGYDAEAEAFFVDRGIDNAFNKNVFFTDKISAIAEPMETDSDGNKKFKLRAIVDRNILEVFLNDGVSTITNTFFMSEGHTPGIVEVAASQEGVYSVDVTVDELVVG